MDILFKLVHDKISFCRALCCWCLPRSLCSEDYMRNLRLVVTVSCFELIANHYDNSNNKLTNTPIYLKWSRLLVHPGP